MITAAEFKEIEANYTACEHEGERYEGWEFWKGSEMISVTPSDNWRLKGERFDVIDDGKKVWNWDDTVPAPKAQAERLRALRSCCVCEGEIEAEAVRCEACKGFFTLPCGYRGVETNMGGEIVRANICEICWDETPQGPTNDYFTGILEDINKA